jgi:hypothetical protein
VRVSVRVAKKSHFVMRVNSKFSVSVRLQFLRASTVKTLTSVGKKAIKIFKNLTAEVRAIRIFLVTIPQRCKSHKIGRAPVAASTICPWFEMTSR